MGNNKKYLYMLMCKICYQLQYHIKAKNFRTGSNNYICLLVFILYKLQHQSWETHYVLLDPIRTPYIEVGEQDYSQDKIVVFNIFFYTLQRNCEFVALHHILLYSA